MSVSCQQLSQFISPPDEELIVGYIDFKVGLYVVEKTQETNVHSHIAQLVV
jgi:hypothetical protein